MLINLHMIVLKLKLMVISDTNIDYEDIYDINDYEYPYNHININDKLK